MTVQYAGWPDAVNTLWALVSDVRTPSCSVDLDRVCLQIRKCIEKLRLSDHWGCDCHQLQREGECLSPMCARALRPWVGAPVSHIVGADTSHTHTPPHTDTLQGQMPLALWQFPSVRHAVLRVVTVHLYGFWVTLLCFLINLEIVLFRLA